MKTNRERYINVRITRKDPKRDKNVHPNLGGVRVNLQSIKAHFDYSSNDIFFLQFRFKMFIDQSSDSTILSNRFYLFLIAFVYTSNYCLGRVTYYNLGFIIVYN